MKNKILIVNAHYYSDISKRLEIGAKTILKKAKIDYLKINVPGIFEIPVTISQNIEKFDGFIALGCVIKGETPHFNFISSATTNALMEISILNKKPITNGIITALNITQAKNRSNIKLKKIKKKNKGIEAAKALVSMLKILN
jgi:6,7-dimethyl-8-ribityllumazine synthase